MTETTSSCTRAERDVLNMIKVWPGIPAIVTYFPDGSWNVSTSEKGIERHLQAKNGIRVESE